MNAIVSIYKNTILAFLFLDLVVAVAAIMFVASEPIMPGSVKALTIAGIVAFVFLTFLLIAWSAIIISIHDRHNEIAEGIHRLADALEEKGNSNEG